MPLPNVLGSKERELLRLSSIIGSVSEPQIADRVHEVGHHGVVEYLDIGADDIRRHRLRLRTDQGTDCAIALPRHSTLQHGAVLLLEKERAIVVRMQERKWLHVAPADTAAALELGYFAGNMHWPVRFEGEHLLIEQQGPAERYLDRLEFMITAKRIKLIVG
jgi:urease accessory protein